MVLSKHCPDLMNPKKSGKNVRENRNPHRYTEFELRDTASDIQRRGEEREQDREGAEKQH